MSNLLRKSTFHTLWFAILTSMVVGCRSPYMADRGAAVGGLAGAGLGAAIGHEKGNTLAGSAIGGALGAITGAAVGSGMDEIDQRNQQRIEESLGRRLHGATTIHDTVAMSQAGVGDEIILNHVQTHGFAGTLTANDIIEMKRQGVSDRVLQGIQNAGLQSNSPAVVQVPVAPAPTPVIVEEHYYARPMHYWHGRPHPRYARPPRRPGVSWGVSFHN